MSIIQKLRIEDKILLHLSDYRDFKGSGAAPKALCQDGMVEALSLHQPQVAKATKSLIKRGLVESKTTYVEDSPRARKIYQLTAKGLVIVNIIKKTLKGINWI